MGGSVDSSNNNKNIGFECQHSVSAHAFPGISGSYIEYCGEYKPQVDNFTLDFAFLTPVTIRSRATDWI